MQICRGIFQLALCRTQVSWELLAVRALCTGLDVAHVTRQHTLGVRCGRVDRTLCPRACCQVGDGKGRQPSDWRTRCWCWAENEDSVPTASAGQAGACPSRWPWRGPAPCLHWAGVPSMQ